MKATNPITLAVLLVSLPFLSTGTGRAIHEPDSDWPSGLSFFAESVVSGNPLDQGDVIYGVRGTYRFFAGDFGLELGIAHSEPTSDFVRSLGDDVELVLADLSFVWYANYHRLYSQASQHDPWHRHRRIKPEVVVFGGPGWASLKIDDAFPNFPLSDASKDYFTLHGGVGVELRWLRDDAARNWDHRTSRWFLRPEVRGRWFAGEDGDVDWSVGLSLGVSFGRRPSELALRLKADEACKEAHDFVHSDVARLLESRTLAVQEADSVAEELREHREYLVDINAFAVSCGPRCGDVRSKVEGVIEEVNEALTKLRDGG